VRRSAAQEEKLRWDVWSIKEHSKNREEFRHPLHFVDDNETSKRLEDKEWIAKSLLVGRVFEVKKPGRLGGRSGKRPGKRRLAALPRAQQSNGRRSSESCPNRGF
jgi:hypothetical protein